MPHIINVILIELLELIGLFYFEGIFITGYRNMKLIFSCKLSYLRKVLCKFSVSRTENEIGRQDYSVLKGLLQTHLLSKQLSAHSLDPALHQLFREIL